MLQYWHPVYGSDDSIWGPEPKIKADSRITSIKVDIIDTPRPKH